MDKSNIIYLLALLFFISCNNPSGENKKTDPAPSGNDLIGANAILVDQEDQEIRDFISRHGWEMKETGTGLRYMVYSHGNGTEAKKDKTAVFHYTLSLITGDVIYTSRNGEPAEFVLGHRGVESGLDEGMQLLKEGDKARLILPSHLAHGVPGDGAKIPRRATLIYDVELLEVK